MVTFSELRFLVKKYYFSSSWRITFAIFVLTTVASLFSSNILYASTLNNLSSNSGELLDKSSIRHLPDFNFVSAGDFGCGDIANQTVNRMLEKKPELVIATGDLSYSKSADCWFNVVSPLDTDGRLKIAIGEHDIDDNLDNLTRFNQYMRHFNLTKPYYSFNYQNAHFLAMATAKNEAFPYANDSEQYRFVNEDLKNASENKDIEWIIVYSFRPFYSSNTTHPGLDELQDIYHPLFDKYGVDLVLQGHNHNYQRTFPLKYNVKSGDDPIITDKHTREYSSDPEGPIFVTVGTGGEDLYNFTGSKPYIFEQFQRHGFLNVDITNNGNNLTATFYENRDMTGKDHFSILKQAKIK